MEMGLGCQTPGANLLVDLQHSTVTDRRQKPIEDPALTPARWASSKREAEKVKHDLLGLPRTVVIFAVHDSRLRGMKRKTARGKALSNRRQHRLRLLFTPTV